jgi:hypothetical protein
MEEISTENKTSEVIEERKVDKMKWGKTGEENISILFICFSFSDTFISSCHITFDDSMIRE